MSDGAAALCRGLRELGVSYVFGLPGTQNLALFEALRSSDLRTVVPGSELTAAFMANGYARRAGTPAVLATIPGPGFLWALPGIGEALLDSTPIVHLTEEPARAPGNAFQLQAFDQSSVARPLVKALIEVATAGEIPGALSRAWRVAVRDEPGPVLLQLARGIYTRQAGETVLLPDQVAETLDVQRIGEIASLVNAAERPLLFLGVGAAEAPGNVARLAERLGAPVVTTTSGRGCLSEDHPLSLGFELAGTRAGPLNALVDRADLVLALGCKFSHNGARGFALKIPPEKLVHVDASDDVLGANYETRVAMQADVPRFLEALEPRLATRASGGTHWTPHEIEAAKRRGLAEAWSGIPEPGFPGLGGRGAQGFFADLRAALPDEGCLVTDSGLHQMLARRWFRVRTPRSLIVPANLQSMGFALPAAMGARLARPDAPVVAVMGDGGFRMMGLELACAVELAMDLTVYVFNDGAYGLIRRGQLAKYGRQHGTELAPVEVEAVASACGAHYVRSGPDAGAAFETAQDLGGVVVIEIPLLDPVGMLVVRARGSARRWLGTRLRRRLRSLLES